MNNMKYDISKFVTTELGNTILNNKYKQQDEDFDQWLDRVSGGDNEIKRLIAERKFLFAGRTLSNRGLTGSLSNCFEKETKVITDLGVKSLIELYECDKKFKTLSKNGVFRDAECRHFGKQELVELIVSKNGVEKTIMTTENHIWFALKEDRRKYNDYYNEITTCNLKEGMYLQPITSKCYTSYKPSPFGVAHGAFYGDGSHSGNYRKMSFCGKKKQLIKYFVPDTVGDSKNVKTICSIPKFMWDKPSLNETKSYLYGFLAGYFATDGNMAKSGSCSISSSKKEDIDLIKDILGVLGLPYGSEKIQNRKSNLTGKYSDIHTIVINKRYLNESFFVLKEDRKNFIEKKTNIRPSRFRVKSVRKTGIIDDVYCLVVPETNCFALDGNILTHNCYSASYAPDSLDGLLGLNKQIGLTYKAQGGEGLSLSLIRPKGATVAGRFTSDGIVPFMKMFDTTTSVVSQAGSRKGALMMSLDAWHPEAKTFITIKEDENAINKANLSLEVDDEFMDNVVYKKVVEDRVMEGEGWKWEHKVDPRALFRQIAESAWKSAEPGILFTNRLRNYHIMQYHPEYEVVTTNPCVTYDTLILTSNGYRKIGEIAESDNPNVNIWNGYEWSDVLAEKTGENQEMVKISFSDGSELECTAYHKFILNNGKRIKAKDLSIGDPLIGCEFPVVKDGESCDPKKAYTQGFFSGDGFVSRSKSRSDRSFIYLYDDKKKLEDYIYYIKAYDCNDAKKRRALQLDNKEYNDKKFVPLNGNLDYKLNWLAGIIDSDGTQQDGSKSISISSIERGFLMDIKYMLNTLGVNSILSVMKKAQDKEIKGKVYHCKECYRLTISSNFMFKLNELGLKLNRVPLRDIKPRVNPSRSIKITNIEKLGVKNINVYCFNEPKNHSGIFNGVVTAQCGEQPLPKHGACNISSINISEYIIDKFTDEANVDFEMLAKDITTIVRAMDDVLEENLPNHALEEQREVAKNYRNIGIGVMGVADALIKMGMEYGSRESIDFIGFLMRFMFRSAMFASSSLAIERGTFPKYDDCIFDSDIVKANFTSSEIERLKLTGIRNCSLLSIAPTGSIGTMLDVSTGIEPLFALKYTRKTESLMGEDAYFDVFPSIVQEYMKLKGITFDELPSFFVSSERINPVDRIRFQGAAQNSVDTAISSTVNLPENATVEDIENIYKQAWFNGLKGVTIYRDGSRAPILSRESVVVNKEKEIKVRPKELSAEIHTVTSKGVRYNVFVGLLDEKPYEIFCQKEIAGIDISALSEFMIIKEGKGRYVFSAANGGIKIMLQENTAEERSHAILISMLLRHNVDLGSIIKTAKKIDDNITSFSSAICRVLSKYIKNNETNELCPECGEKLMMTAGCKSCTCGFSQCG